MIKQMKATGLALILAIFGMGFNAPTSHAQDNYDAIFDSLFNTLEAQKIDIDALKAAIEALPGSGTEVPFPVDTEIFAMLEAEVARMRAILDVICGDNATPENCKAVAALPSARLPGQIDSLPIGDYVIAVDPEGAPSLVTVDVAKQSHAVLPPAEDCKSLGEMLVSSVPNRQDNQFYVRDVNNRVRLCKFVSGNWHELAARKTNLAHLLEKAAE